MREQLSIITNRQHQLLQSVSPWQQKQPWGWDVRHSSVHWLKKSCFVIT